mgnify:CR=1 FL=1
MISEWFGRCNINQKLLSSLHLVDQVIFYAVTSDQPGCYHCYQKNQMDLIMESLKTTKTIMTDTVICKRCNKIFTFIWFIDDEKVWPSPVFMVFVCYKTSDEFHQFLWIWVHLYHHFPAIKMILRYNTVFWRKLNTVHTT